MCKSISSYTVISLDRLGKNVINIKSVNFKVSRTNVQNLVTLQLIQCRFIYAQKNPHTIGNFSHCPISHRTANSRL